MLFNIKISHIIRFFFAQPSPESKTIVRAILLIYESFEQRIIQIFQTIF